MIFEVNQVNIFNVLLKVFKLMEVFDLGQEIVIEYLHLALFVCFIQGFKWDGTGILRGELGEERLLFDGLDLQELLILERGYDISS